MKNVVKTDKKNPLPEKKTAEGSKTAAQPNVTGAFAFGKENYILLLAGLFFILLGFLLMIGGGSKDPRVFNNEIFDFRRLTLAPILILAGYVIELFAIMKKPRD